jgi:hypothetical protein
MHRASHHTAEHARTTWMGRADGVWNGAETQRYDVNRGLTW